MNKVILIGRLTRDIEIRYSQSAEPVAVGKFSLAVTRKFKKQNEPECDFINCIAFGKTAENIGKFFAKGRMIAVTGRIQCGSYDNKDGLKVYTTDIIVDEFFFTGEKKQDSQEQNQGHSQQPLQNQFYSVDDSDEDLPF